LSDRTLVGFIHWPASFSYPNGSNGTGIDCPFNFGLPRRCQDVARSQHITAVQLLPLSLPERIVGCNVEENLAALHLAG
jgi:hypothetical protein